MTQIYNFEPCPFCGHDLNKQEPLDTIYKTFRKQDGTWVYNVVCNETYGGCDAFILGDSREEAYRKWNTRVCK